MEGTHTMELLQIKSKKYEHVFEASEGADGDRAALYDKIVSVMDGRLCQRVLMIQCPQIGEETFNVENAKLKRYPSFPPYGPCLLVRVLEANGYDADIVDLDFEVIDQVHRVADYNFRSVWVKKLTEKLDEFKPDLVGISCMYNRSHSTLKAIVQFLSENYPDIIITAGGVHISLTTDQLLLDVPGIDFALLYEGDQSFISFLDVANSRKPADALAQIAAVHDGRLIKLTKRVTPQDLIYSPDYKDLPIQRYASVGKIGAYTFLRPSDTPTATVLSARGCRAKCGFCSVRSVNGPGVRTRDIDDVIAEIRRLRDRYGVRHVMWLDDDIFYDGQRAIDLFEELAAKKLGVTHDMSNGVIAAALNPRLLKACSDSGCIGFNIGIESGNPDMLLQMKKPGTVASFRRAAGYLRDFPEIFTKGFLIVGFPNETLSMLLDTIKLAVEMELDWYPAQILTPMQGTPIFQMMEDLNLLGDIPATVLGKARTFSVGAMGSLGKRERLEKENAKDFNNLFSGDLSRIPNRSEMEDLYFCVDYEVNYKIILTYTDRDKLLKKRSMLREICERMTTENALGTLYWAIAEHKLGNGAEAKRLIDLAWRYVAGSDFWRKHFEALGIDDVLDDYSSRI